jgi:multicomponent Na+:H+ antiporter subunit B
MTRFRRVSALLAVVAAAGFGAALIVGLGEAPTPAPLTGTPADLSARTGASNLVAAVYLSERLYDTLFELLVFSVAVLGVRFYLGERREAAISKPIPESHVVRASAEILFPLILLLGLYVTLLGHLSPGGGFAGGVVAASGLILCSIALGAEVVARRYHKARLERLEWGLPLAVLIWASLPLAFGMPLLADPLPRGEAGRLLSAGSIPIYNALIGLKVFIGAWLVVHAFIRHRGEV